MTESALARTLLLCRDFVSNEVSDDVIERRFRATRVCIVADEENLRSIAGQSLVTTLAGLVLAMGCVLGLVMPDVPVRGHQPPLSGPTLRSGIANLATDGFPGGHAETLCATRPTDLVFIVGDSPWSGEARHAWRLTGTKWAGSIAATTSNGNRWAHDFPIGALASATLAAAEPFKAVLRDLGATNDELALVTAANVSLGDDRIRTRDVHLGHVDCVSAGAITQGFLHALFRVPGISAALRVIEPDALEITNLNRYLLARLDQLGIAKTTVVAASAPASVLVKCVNRRVTRETLPGLGPLADQVVVGTDDIPSRWLVQEAHPTWLAIGATAHFMAVSSEHQAGLPCARCMHPHDDDVNDTIPTVSFVSYWAGLMIAARLLRRALAGPCADSAQAVLLHSLQLNGKHARHEHRVFPRPDCPFGCGAVSTAPLTCPKSVVSRRAHT